MYHHFLTAVYQLIQIHFSAVIANPDRLKNRLPPNTVKPPVFRVVDRGGKFGEFTSYFDLARGVSFFIKLATMKSARGSRFCA